MNTSLPYNSLGYILPAHSTDTQILAYNNAQIATFTHIASGTLIYNTDEGLPYIFDGDDWVPFAGPIFDPLEHTKQVVFDMTAIPAGTTRSLIMPNANVDLRELWDVPENLKLLTNDEAAQLLNINANIISVGNWGYLSTLDQTVGVGASPTFGSPLLKTSLVLEDPGVGTRTITIAAPDLSTTASWQLTLPASAGPQFQLLRNEGTGTLGWSSEVTTGYFRIGDYSDPTPANWKRIAFALAPAFAAGAERTITMPNANVDLGTVAAIPAPSSGSQFQVLRNEGGGTLSWSSELSNSNLRIGDYSDPTPANWKRLSFTFGPLFPAGGEHTIIMPDADVDLGNIAAIPYQAINGVKTYTANFVVAADPTALPIPVWPRMDFNFVNTAPFYADIRLLTTDFTNTSRVGIWCGKVCGGTSGLDAPAALEVSEVSASGDILAQFATVTTTTASKLTLVKDANFSGVGNYWCKVFVSVGNGTLSSITDPNNGGAILATFTY